MKTALIYFILHSIIATAYCVYLEQLNDIKEASCIK